MSQAEKAALWRELKDAGVTFDQHYRDYSTDTLERAVYELRQTPAEAAPEPAGQPPRVIPRTSEPDQLAGLRLNTLAEDEPLRVDEAGLIWFQDEVRKAAFPKPRGRRVLKYIDPGVKTVTVSNGDYTESFEMPGTETRQSEAKITLPSYQVGIYQDPRFPFKIHVYNENRGFDLFEVERFYGGGDLVPDDIKRVYVENSLCYDIRTTVRAIQTEYRDRVLPKETK